MLCLRRVLRRIFRGSGVSNLPILCDKEIRSRTFCNETFNIDRLLHCGKYRREGEKLIQEKITFRNTFRKLIGIDSQYTTGDKILKEELEDEKHDRP